jgi:hypothetical protein
MQKKTNYFRGKRQGQVSMNQQISQNRAILVHFDLPMKIKILIKCRFFQEIFCFFRGSSARTDSPAASGFMPNVKKTTPETSFDIKYLLFAHCTCYSLQAPRLAVKTITPGTKVGRYKSLAPCSKLRAFLEDGVLDSSYIFLLFFFYTNSPAKRP